MRFFLSSLLVIILQRKTFSLIPQSGNFILASLSKTFCAATQSFLWGMPQCAIIVVLVVVVVPTKLTSKCGRKEWGSLWGSWQQSRLGCRCPRPTRGRCVERCAGGGGLRGGSSAAARAEQSRPRALQSSSSATSSCLLKALHLRRTHNTQHTTDDNNNNDRRQQVNVITEQLPLSAPPAPFPSLTCKRRLKSL